MPDQLFKEPAGRPLGWADPPVIKRSYLGSFRLETYLQQYCKASEKVRAASQFFLCHGKRIPQDRKNLAEMVLGHARKCLDENCLIDAERHAKSVIEIVGKSL